jgi:hypothetical protein
VDKHQISKTIKDSVIDVIDHGVNLASDNDVIKEIPIIKYLASANNIREIYKAKKMHRNVLRFLESIKNTEQDIEIEEENLDEFIDTLRLILLESEKPIKAHIVGSLMSAYGRKTLNFTTFNHLCLIVHSALVPALYNLVLCANPEMLAVIDDFEAKHSSAKTDGIAPNISTRIVGVKTVIPLLSTLGVLENNGFLNGYGMVLVKYGQLVELEQPRMDIFRDKVL